MPNKKKTSDSIALINRDSTFGFVPREKNIYEGERLTCLLQSLKTKIESAKLVDGDNLPEKFWFKQQFAIGINEVTRVLERMTSSGVEEGNPAQQPCSSCHRKAPSIQLQVVLLASDCNPRWLTKHMQNLALSRNVPLIFVKDKKAGSLRLGELVKIKTAIAIGVKVKGNLINGLFQKILHGNLVDFGTDSIKLTKMLDDTQLSISFPKVAIRTECLIDDELKGFGQSHLHPRSQGVETLESQLVEAVDRDLRKILINPNAKDPLVLGVRVWPQAILQFLVGHFDVLDAAKTALTDAGFQGLFLGGNYASGVALGRCVEGAYEVAAEVADFLIQYAYK